MESEEELGRSDVSQPSGGEGMSLSGSQGSLPGGNQAVPSSSSDDDDDDNSGANHATDEDQASTSIWSSSLDEVHHCSTCTTCTW